MSKRNPIPPEAKMVFKGKIFQVWQWEQKMYDGSLATFERLKRPDTTEVIATVGEKIIVLEQEQPDVSEPYLCLPGGRIDEGEEPVPSAQRELLEETGFESANWQLFSEHAPVSKIEWTIFTFVARDCVKKQEPHLDAGERIALKEYSFEDFLMLSEDPRFHSRDLTATLLRARSDEAKKNELRSMLFAHA